MNKLTILAYTHSDMKDMWEIFFGQFRKYLVECNVYIATDKFDDSIPIDYKQIHYDDSKKYTERLQQILPQVEEDIILFLHEDMILLDFPMYDYLKKYFAYVNDDMVDSIKLIYAGNYFTESIFDKTLVTNEHSKFSIQPTLIKTKTFIKILEKFPPLNIWDFENAVTTHNRDFMVKIGEEKKRGIFHYDSLVFPYIATAINKGKWNYTEYQKELDSLFKEYDINPFERGIV
jgi:hypothetical protein